MSELVAGTSVDGYTIEAPLSSGGFGALYRARAAGRTVAIKVLLADLAAEEEATRRFEREVIILRRLRHRHIVEVLAVGRLPDQRPYYVMEMLEGQDLAARIAERGRLAVPEVLAIIEPIAGALDAAHAAGVVHRDIKAQNVFRCRDGRPVLLDFGIAKLTDAGMTLTHSRQTLGTPAAMAPEQLVGGTIDARTDVYGLGGLTYHMLAGTPPFAAETATLTRHLHRLARRPRPSLVTGEHAELDDVVVRAMSIAPADRYRSAGEMAAALRGAALGAEQGEQRVQALAVHIEVDPARDPDPMPEVLRRFEERGFLVAVEGSWSAVLVRPLDGERSAAVDVALPGVRVTSRVGEVALAGRRVTGGPLLDLADWESEP